MLNSYQRIVYSRIQGICIKGRGYSLYTPKEFFTNKTLGQQLVRSRYQGNNRSQSCRPLLYNFKNYLYKITLFQQLFRNCVYYSRIKESYKPSFYIQKELLQYLALYPQRICNQYKGKDITQNIRLYGGESGIYYKSLCQWLVCSRGRGISFYYRKPL